MKLNTDYDIETLYRLYYNIVYRYVLLINFNKSEAEDIVQNTFLKAMSGLKNFRGDSNIKTWLLTIARNESIRYSAKQTSCSPFDELAEFASSVSIEDIVCSKETTLFILSYIRECKEPKKSLLTLHLLYEMSFVEIGTILNKSDTWCRVTFMRAKNDMIKRLEECS